MGITAGSREVPGRNAYDKRHTYRIIIITKANVVLKHTINLYWFCLLESLPTAVGSNNEAIKTTNKYKINVVTN